MPDAPSASDLQTRFPAFADVADATIDYWITDAQLIVTSNWIDDDFQPAIMELAAHNMALLGLESGTSSVSVPAGVTRFRSGSLDMSISEAVAKANAAGSYKATVYGRMFLPRLRRSRGGPISVQSDPPDGIDIYWPTA